MLFSVANLHFWGSYHKNPTVFLLETTVIHASYSLWKTVNYTVLVSGAAKGKKIFPSLQEHFLLKVTVQPSPAWECSTDFLFKQSIGSCDLCTLISLKVAGHNRFLNILMKYHLHPYPKCCPWISTVQQFLSSRTKPQSPSKSIQHIGIYLNCWLQLSFCSSFFSSAFAGSWPTRSCLVHIHHLFWRTFFQLRSLIQKNPVTVPGNTA